LLKVSNRLRVFSGLVAAMKGLGWPPTFFKRRSRNLERFLPPGVILVCDLLHYLIACADITAELTIE
jgi:hypothetical protein